MAYPTTTNSGADNLVAFVLAVREKCQTLLDNQGALTNLTTTEKTSLVLAINELVASLASVNDAIAKKAQIDDTQTTTTNAWSASKISTEISTAATNLKNDLLGGAGEAYDTLKELGDLIDDNKAAIEALQTIAAGHVKYDGAQTLTSSQKQQARDNIDTVSTAQLNASNNVAFAANNTAVKNRTNIGTLANLTTTAKTSLVEAINEVNGAIPSDYVKHDEAQSLTDTQKAQARSNIGAAAESHTHAIADVTGLQDALDAIDGGSSGGEQFTLANNAAAHNCIYRGIDLSTKYTEEEISTKLTAGDFSDLYIGDYIPKTVTINGASVTCNWILAHFDYFAAIGSMATKKHHVVLVPSKILYSTSMNSAESTSGGYTGSNMYKTEIPKIVTGLKSAFGDSHVTNVYNFLSSKVDDSLSSNAGCGLTGAVPKSGGYTTISGSCNLMTEPMVFGSTYWTSSPAEIMTGKTQFALFRLNSQAIPDPTSTAWWLSGVVSSALFCMVDGTGSPFWRNPSFTVGVRPYFVFI